MSNRPVKKGERHHWWPMSLSKRWLTEDGVLNRVDSEGRQIRISPKSAARISNAHNIYFDDTDVWQETYEHAFDEVDAAFPWVVSWLEELAEYHLTEKIGIGTEFVSHEAEDEKLDMLLRCMLSLAIRAPKMRYKAESFIRLFRSRVEKRELMNLIALNLRDLQESFSESLSGRGKFALLIASEGEYIYGDGFYHTLPAQHNGYGHNETILAPITPRVTVLYSLPMEFMVEPRLVARVAGRALIDLVNGTTQTYSKDCLFYRGEPPTLSEEFLRGEHLVFSQNDPITALVKTIPGVINRAPRMSLTRRSQIDGSDE